MSIFTKELLHKLHTKLSQTDRLLVSLFNEGKELNEEQKESILLAVCDQDKSYIPNLYPVCDVLGLSYDRIPYLKDRIEDRYGSRNGLSTPELEKSLKKAVIATKKKIANLPTHGKLTLDRDDEGRAYCTIENMSAALSYLGITVKRNLFTSNIEIKGLEDMGFPNMEDAVVDWIEFRVAKADVKLRASGAEVQKAIRQVAHINRYHPIKEYLESLVWDGTPRLDTWVLDHAGADDSSYTRAVSALPLMAAVKRIYNPGSKFDEMLVLCSGQGFYKSSALECLAGGQQWFTDSLPLGAPTKEVMETTTGKWIIEAADLDKYGKVEHNKLKAFMSRRSDRARLAFARIAEEIPRQWVIVGTVNEDQFLSDPTGDRRYWPLTVTKPFDCEALATNRDQLWAEAYHRAIINNESIRLDKSLWETAANIRESFTLDNPLKDKLAQVLIGQQGVILKSYLWDLCGIPTQSRSKASMLNKAMKDLGWTESTSKLKDRSSIRVWKKGESTRWLKPVMNLRLNSWEFISQVSPEVKVTEENNYEPPVDEEGKEAF